MRYYETLYIINPNLSDDENGEVISKFNDLVANKKGVAVKIDEWGKRTLAYSIKKFNKGFYVLLQYCGDGSIVAEVERGMRLDERILQYQTVKLSDDVDPDELVAMVEKEKQDKETTAAAEASSENDTEPKDEKEE